MARIGDGGLASPIVVGFSATASTAARAASEAPETPSPWGGAGRRTTPGSGGSGSGSGGGSASVARSLLSSMLRDVRAAAAAADAIMGAATAAEECDYDDFDDDFDDDDDDDAAGLDADDLAMLDALDAAWGSPASSALTRASGGASSGSRPIAIPDCSYFKDAAQRAHLERLNQKRQWHSQQRARARPDGAKAAAQHAAQARPPAQVHRQQRGHGAQK